MSDVLLNVSNLAIEFDTDEGLVRAVDGLSFAIKAGETLGIVGESGCGKSVTALSLMRLLPQPMGKIASGSIQFEGKDLAQAPIAELEQIRGARIGMVFQEPMTALNPVMLASVSKDDCLHCSDHVCSTLTNTLRPATDIQFVPEQQG